MEQKTEQLQKMLDGSQRVVFFGGAGVSTESGIPDFRSVDGLYHQKYKYPPETIISRTFFEEHPEEFYDFYRDKMLCLTAKPNAAHKKLAELEQMGKLTAVITQNIDGLHQRAGSQNVLELHGSVHRNYCQKCHAGYDACFIKESQGVPTCSCGGVIKPDVILYEESLDESILEKAIQVLSEADMLLIGGTSLVVYPAAGLVHYFRGNYTVVINRGKISMREPANLWIQDKIGKVLERIRV